MSNLGPDSIFLIRVAEATGAFKRDKKKGAGADATEVETSEPERPFTERLHYEVAAEAKLQGWDDLDDVPGFDRMRLEATVRDRHPDWADRLLAEAEEWRRFTREQYDKEFRPNRPKPEKVTILRSFDDAMRVASDATGNVEAESAPVVDMDQFRQQDPHGE